MSILTYNPPQSVVPFLVSDKFASFIVGPYASTKTTAGIMKIAFEAAKVAKCSDGVRRSRYAVVRNTRQMLFDTTIPDFLKWFPDGEAGLFMKSEAKFILKFDDVESEILFRGLDDANDVRRLLSLQLTGGLMDEFREIHPDIYEALAGRTGRYPDKVLIPPRPEWGVDYKGNPIGGCVQDDGKPAKRVWGMSNPPDMDTFWEQLLTDPPNNVHVTMQPSGLSPDADWVHLLDSGYYENLVELHKGDPDWVDVYVHSKFGKSLAGRPVYRSFSQDFHVAKETLKPIVSENHPLLVGIDFGLCYSEDTEVLTKDGWKFFKDVDETKDIVATLNPEGFGLEYTPINFKVEYDYDGELIHFKSQNYDCLVTPEHRTPFTHRDTPNKLVFTSAEDLEAHKTSHRFLQLQAHWEGKPMEWFGLPDEQAAAFLGWYLSEGSISSKGNNRRVCISQKKPSPDLDALMRDNTWWPNTKWVKDSAGWRASVPTEVGDYLRELGKSWTKYVPDEIRWATKDTIRAFLRAYIAGDGHVRTKAKQNSGVGCKVRNEINMATVSVALADGLQELALKAGWGSSKRVQKARTTYMADGRKIECPDIFIITIKQYTRAEICSNHVSRVPYKGKIYCLNVPYHTLYVRRNGRPCWNGNTPACTISQQDPRGRILTYDELTSEGMGILRFCRELLKPLLASKYPGFPIIVIGDPAGVQRAQTDERTAFDVLKSEGFKAIPAKTNSIAARIAAVEGLLSAQIDGSARHLIDPGCKKLITGFRGGYRYKVKKTGETEDKPDKNFYSHIMDAHSYAALHVDNVVGSARFTQPSKRDVVTASMYAWT
jgi:hypothetical protein